MDDARASRMTAELINTFVGGWKILEFLGAGKSALVFKAQKDATIGALKIFDPELVQRFGTDVQSARIDRELSLRGKHHPNLVRILDGGHCLSSGLYYVAMELLNGKCLADKLKTVPRSQISSIMSQIASAAEFLETLGLVHRDIKPDNIFVASDFTHCWLMDFGVIRPIGEPGITDGDQRPFIGTLQYSSPEFLFRTEDDTPSGWQALTFYQLGAVLHDLIMRERIFVDHTSPFARLVEAVKGITPRVEAGDVSPELVLLARSCLSKDPSLRLRLVDWDSFTPQGTRTVSQSSTIERIRKRQLLAKGSSAATPEIVDQTNRVLRRTVDYAEEKVQALIRKECVGSGLFPPLQIFGWQGTTPDETAFVITFESSPEHALNKCLQIWFLVKLLDQASIGIHISVAASLHTVALDPLSRIQKARITLFEGPFEESSVDSKLRSFLYFILDEAQADQSGSSTMDDNHPATWLACEGMASK